MKALPIAIENGLSLPIVYNTSGYDSLETIKLLEGIVDIYMPDIKFLNSQLSKQYCHAENYPEIVTEVVKAMQRQTGDLIIDESGVAKKGLLIRHLLMPSCEEDTKMILRFICNEISKNAFVNIMAQYHPCHRADEFKNISHRISMKEHMDVIRYAEDLGLTRALNH